MENRLTGRTSNDRDREFNFFDGVEKSVYSIDYFFNRAW
jgi:hypothetical protein